MTLRTLLLNLLTPNRVRANALCAPRFRRFAMEPLRVSTLTGFNRISQGGGVMFRAIGEAIGRRAAKQAVTEFVESGKFRDIIEDMVTKELAKPEYAWLRFIKAMQAEMCRVDPIMAPRAAFIRARDIYNEYLRDEKIEFGDPRFDWSIDGAKDVIHSMEIDHWERRA